jgi:RNA-binding protein
MADDELVSIRVGKNGVTPALVEEIKAVLKKRKKLKVKMLKTSLAEKDKNAMTEEIRRACKARRASLLGHTITLEK